jgi:hypothetical protein
VPSWREGSNPFIRTNYHGFVLLPFLAALFYNFQHGAFFFASFLKNSIEVFYFSNIILH